MYYLDQLTLKNVRSYRDQPSTIVFSPNLTIITGHNGAGKSTLLEALLYLLSQDRPVYDRIEPKGASDGSSMLMQCILRHGRSAAEEKQESIKDPNLHPPLKVSAKGKKSQPEISAALLKSNQILFELKRTIKRVEGGRANSTRRNRTPYSPELSAALQLYDGLFQYCLLCSVSRSHWMFDTPEEISKSTDQILNVDRFTKLSKEFSPSLKESASSEACYNVALKAVINQEEALHNLNEEISIEEKTKDKLKREYNLLVSLSDDYTNLNTTYADICDLLESNTASNDSQVIANAAHKSFQTQLASIPISTFLSQRTSTSKDGLFSYLTVRSGDDALLKTYNRILKANRVSDSPAQMEEIKAIFSKHARDGVLKEGVLLANWEKLKAEHDPQSISNFIEKYKAVLTLLESIRRAGKDAEAIVSESNNANINTKCNLIESFYENVLNYTGSFELNGDSGNIDALEKLCLELSMICTKVVTIDDVINSNIEQMQRDLELTNRSIDTLDTSILAEQSNQAAIHMLVSLSNSLSERSAELQALEHEESRKRNVFQDLSNTCMNLRMSVSQHQKAHNSLTCLYTNYYVSSERLIEMKNNLIQSTLLTCIPVLLSVAMKQQKGQEKDIGTACRHVLSIWKNNWSNLILCLKSTGYPGVDALTDITKKISPNCLFLLNKILNFIDNKIQDCTSIELKSLFIDSNDLSESLSNMVEKIYDILHSWLTATGNMASIIPTLRSDFSIYIKKRTELSESTTKDMLALFDDFLSGYKQEAAQQKADLVKAVVSMLTAFTNILPIALECQGLNMFFDDICAELFKLESIGGVLQKIMLSGCDISSSGDRADVLFYQIFYSNSMFVNTMSCNSFPLLAPQLSYQSIDCLTIKDTINTFMDKLILAARHLEDTYTKSERELNSLKEQLNGEESNLMVVKQEFEEAENLTKSTRSNISQLKQQFLETSIDGQPYSLEYAQKLSKQDMYISERLRCHNEERREMVLKANTLQKELDALTRDASQISLPGSTTISLTHEELLNMKNALERIKKSPSVEEVEAAASSYQVAHIEALHLKDISAMLNEYATAKEFLANACTFMNKIKSQSADYVDYIYCKDLLSTVKKAEKEIKDKCQTLENVLDSLNNILTMYGNAKRSAEIELYKKEGSMGEKKAHYEKMKCELKTSVEKYAESKASLLIIKGACMLSTTMHRTVKEFKHMLLKKLNNKLQSLWNQCYAHSGDAQNEISTVRLAITQLGAGDKAKDVIELQAICNDIDAGQPVVRSFRETCSSGQQVLLSILLRLAFSYISMSPFSFIVLDEPTNYLDKENSKNLANVLADFISSEQNTQVIIITHSLEFCDALISATNNTNTRTYKVSMDPGGSQIHEIV